MSLGSRGLFIALLIALVLALGCCTSEIPSNKQVTQGEFEFTYSKITSVPSIQISSGNLVWHKKLPSTTYTLEGSEIEIYNFGDVDTFVARLEMKVGENSKVFDINMVVPAGVKRSVVVEPMIEGYDGGTHIVDIALLDENGRILYEADSQEVGPLEPVMGSVCWN